MGKLGRAAAEHRVTEHLPHPLLLILLGLGLRGGDHLRRPEWLRIEGFKSTGHRLHPDPVF